MNKLAFELGYHAAREHLTKQAYTPASALVGTLGSSMIGAAQAGPGALSRLGHGISGAFHGMTNWIGNGMAGVAGYPVQPHTKPPFANTVGNSANLAQLYGMGAQGMLSPAANQPVRR